jgi:hypothetical protein
MQDTSVSGKSAWKGSNGTSRRGERRTLSDDTMMFHDERLKTLIEAIKLKWSDMAEEMEVS